MRGTDPRTGASRRGARLPAPVLMLLLGLVGPGAGCGDDDGAGNNQNVNDNTNTNTNVNACATDNGGCAQTCTALGDGAYACSCEAGYALATDDHACDDVDECAVENGGCDHFCENTPAGSYTCSCEPGFDLDADGHTCVINPCEPGCGSTEWCGDGAVALDNNCDGQVDEGCPCTPGTYQACFKGDPVYRAEPGCVPGVQVCIEVGVWGDCTGGVHATDQCFSASATGCHALSGLPFVPNQLKDGTGTFSDDAVSESWVVECPDGVSPCPAVGGTNPMDDFTALQSGEYTVTYTKVTGSGSDQCTYPLFVGAPGLRVELDWEHDLGGTGVDLDLHVHQPGDTTPWGADSGTPTECAWDNCKASSFTPPGIGGPDWFNGVAPPDPVNWYLDPVQEKNTCYYGPSGADWQSIAQGCHNPRLDTDNISCNPLTTDPMAYDFCAPENINIDFPPVGEWTRIGVHYYSNHGVAYSVHPRVRIFCDGHLAAELGHRGYYDSESPVSFLPNDGEGGDANRFWLVADVALVDDGCGSRYCLVQPLYEDAPGRTPLLTTVAGAKQSFGPAYPPAP